MNFLEHMLLARINLKQTVGMKTECNYSLRSKWN